MTPLQVVDYGGGNLGSVLRCLQRLQVPHAVVGGPGQDRPRAGAPLLLPGVGAFGAVMAALAGRDLVAPLRDLLAQGTPYLGICVGLQILFDGSAESPGVAGLGVLPGRVVRYEQAPGLKVPQIGWNLVTPAAGVTGAEPGHVYFVNSYHAVPGDPALTLYQADYGGPFCAAVRRGALTAFQFHPERSGPFGHALVRRFYDGAVAR